MKKQCFILGTRPEIIKMATLIKTMKPFVLHTGQHRELAEEAFKIFDISPDVNLDLMSSNQKLSHFIINGAKAVDKIVKKHKFDRILVQGDTSTALIGATVAHVNRIPLVHLEAGLRSGDRRNPWPEEVFRTVVDHMADVLLAPTEENAKNLKKENVKGDIHVVGNTIIDALNLVKPRLSTIRPYVEPYILLTMHRRESFSKDIYTVFSVIKQLSDKIKVVFPMHPNPNVKKAAKVVGISTIEPLNYLDFLWHLKHCEFVMSDSGGIQEEVPEFNKPILILRKVTERQEILNTKNAFLTTFEKSDIYDKINKIKEIKQCQYFKNPFGDGKTTLRVRNILD